MRVSKQGRYWILAGGIAAFVVAVFGIAVGSILSMTGRVAAFAAGYLVGSLGLRRFAPEDDGTA